MVAFSKPEAESTSCSTRACRAREPKPRQRSAGQYPRFPLAAAIHHRTKDQRAQRVGQAAREAAARGFRVHRTSCGSTTTAVVHDAAHPPLSRARGRPACRDRVLTTERGSPRPSKFAARITATSVASSVAALLFHMPQVEVTVGRRRARRDVGIEREMCGHDLEHAARRSESGYWMSSAACTATGARTGSSSVIRLSNSLMRPRPPS